MTPTRRGFLFGLGAFAICKPEWIMPVKAIQLPTKIYPLPPGAYNATLVGFDLGGTDVGVYTLAIRRPNGLMEIQQRIVTAKEFYL